MRRKMKQRYVYLSAAACLLVLALFGERYFAAQEKSYAQVIARVNSYWMIGSPESLKRQAALGTTMTQDRARGVSPKFEATSSIETLIFLQVRDRKEKTQKVRIYIATRNASWIRRIQISGPSAEIFEKWKESPSIEQVRGMIYSTIETDSSGSDVTLWPRQARLIYADFVFPYPMKLDFTASSYFIENWNDEEKAKSVRDSVLLRAEDLNATKVLP